MAIFHFDRNGVSIGRGQGAVASCAYMTGERVVCERTGKRLRYAHSDRVLAHEVHLTEAAPSRWSDHEALWNEAEAAWPGGNAAVAHREKMALPRELSGDLEALKEIVRDYAIRSGDVCEWAIHDERDGNGNIHAHFLFPDLPVGPDGFERPSARKTTKAYLCRDPNGEDCFVMADDWRALKGDGYEKVFNFKDGKRRSMSEARAAGLDTSDRKSKAPVAVTVTPDGEGALMAERSKLVARRKLWAECVNRGLEKAGFEERVSHLSNAARGIEELPGKHLGHDAAAMERRAKAEADRDGRKYVPVTRIGRENAAIARENAWINVRELCLIASERAQTIYQFRKMLDGWGAPTEERDGRLYVGDEDYPGEFMAVDELARELTPEGLERAFTANVAAEIREKGAAILAERRAREAEAARVQGIKDGYLKVIRDTYAGYRKRVASMRGAKMRDIPKFKLPRPPKEVKEDGEVKSAILAAWRRGDDLRTSMASDAPVAKPRTAGTGGYQQPEYQPAPERGRGRPAPSQER